MRPLMARVLLAASLVLARAGEGFAHARLVRSEPASGSVVTVPPSYLELVFNSLVERRFARITLFTPTTSRSLSVAPQKGRTVKALRVPLPRLESGSYRVEWSVVARDSHRVEGAFTFEVR